MEIILITASVIFTLLGLLGCVLPAIPGPPLSFIAMLFIQWAWHPFSVTTLVVIAILTLVVTVLDYVIPVWGAKYFGATKYGIYGSVIGMLIGMFLTPVGMIAGLLLGAIIGDVISGKKITDAMGSGVGTFLGTMAGMLDKLILSGVITFMVFYKVVAWIAERDWF